MTAEKNDDPDNPEFWEHNEYLALKVMFAGAAYYDAAQGDPEIHARYKADRRRLDMLHAKFGPPK